MIKSKKIKLGNCLNIISGYAFKSKFFNEVGDGLPLIRVRNVNSGFSGLYYSGDYEDKFLVKNGDVLVGMDGDFKCIKWNQGTALLNQRVCKLVPNEKINKSFLLQFLPNILNDIHSKTTYTTVKHLSVKQIKDIDIDLPSLSDQKRIAQVLTDCKELIAKRKESIALLDGLLKSSFLEMFWEKNPEYRKWQINTIESYALKRKGSMRSGPFGSSLLHEEFSESGDVKVLGIDNVVNNSFEEGKPRFITLEKYKELRRYTVYPGDVLISIMATNGRSAVVPENIPLAINSKHLAAISLNQEIILPISSSYS